MTGNRVPADVDAVAHLFVNSLADTCTVDGDDGHHLQRVRRLVPGERVTAADGTGAWRTYTIANVAPGSFMLEAVDVSQDQAPPAVAIALAVALTKGGIDDVAASVTELGVARITPVHAARTIVRWDADKTAQHLARLERVAREAAMQSRRTRIPVIEGVATVADIAASADLVVADRSGVRASALLPPEAGEWTVLVGPEGGFAPEEREMLSDRPRLALADTVLRAVTAPIAAVAVLEERIAQMRPT
ncbi:MAG TPA: RsmE family RNA methyltransferase [Acidimicrobiia bacterium]|nr:RsmE family RNA methyltransferase [Acidimicrobiia bacterium]